MNTIFNFISLYKMVSKTVNTWESRGLGTITPELIDVIHLYSIPNVVLRTHYVLNHKKYEEINKDWNTKRAINLQK